MQELEGRLEAAGEERQQLGDLQEGLLQEQEQLQAAMDLQQQAHRSTEVGPPLVPRTVTQMAQGMCKGWCLRRPWNCSSRPTAAQRWGRLRSLPTVLPWSSSFQHYPMVHARDVQGMLLAAAGDLQQRANHDGGLQQWPPGQAYSFGALCACLCSAAVMQTRTGDIHVPAAAPFMTKRYLM